MNGVSRIISAFALLVICATHAPAQDGDEKLKETVVSAPLSLIADKRRVALVVSRSLSIDTRGKVRGVIHEVFDQASPSPLRHEYGHKLIARRLEKYASAGGGLTLVEDLKEADFVIVYKIVKQVSSYSMEEPFLYGEMFVFLNSMIAEDAVPPLLWRTKNDRRTPDDAAKDFIKELMAVRGER